MNAQLQAAAAQVGRTRAWLHMRLAAPPNGCMFSQAGPAAWSDAGHLCPLQHVVNSEEGPAGISTGLDDDPQMRKMSTHTSRPSNSTPYVCRETGATLMGSPPSHTAVSCHAPKAERHNSAMGHEAARKRH
jgi:hypothetical protein